MKRMLCMLLVLILVPCLALSENVTLLTSFPLQVTEPVTCIDGVYRLTNGHYLICYEAAQADDECLQVQAIVTPDGACVWEQAIDSHDLMTETVNDKIILQPDGFGTLYFYDADLREVSRMDTPIDHGEVVKLAQQGNRLYCFAMYAGDWESYKVYTCDLTTGQWADDVPFVRLPNEYCSLRNVIPYGDGFLLLVAEGDTEEHPAPFGPDNWNYTDKNLYAMDAGGSLTLAMELHGDAQLVYQEEESFTLLAKDESGLYALRTCSTLQEIPLP